MSSIPHEPVAETRQIPRSLGICLAILAHTTYHLGGLRQVLRSVS